MPVDKPGIMQLLTESGYRTHGIGKMHFTPDLQALCGFQTRERQEELVAGVEDDDYLIYLMDKGYEHIFDPHGQRSEMYYIPQISQLPAQDHPSQWVGDRSIDFLRSHNFAQPFFLMSSFVHPHPPFAPPTPWNKLYRAKYMPHPNVPEGYEDCITYINRYQNRYKYRDQGIDRNLVRTQKAFYYSCISFIDYQVGRILDLLEELDQLDNTMILLTSDHGELLGDYNSFGKRSMLDSAARIPMLARYPEMLQSGLKCTKPTSLVDIMPTILEVAGVEGDSVYMDGESLFRVASGKSKREFVYSQFQRAGMGIYMVASEDKKYIYSAPNDKEYFFDSCIDTMETKNMASCEKDHPDSKTLRENLTEALRLNGRESAVDNNGWIRYPRLQMSCDPNEGLLFQDNLFKGECESNLPPGLTINLHN